MAGPRVRAATAAAAAVSAISSKQARPRVHARLISPRRRFLGGLRNESFRPSRRRRRGDWGADRLGIYAAAAAAAGDAVARAVLQAAVLGRHVVNEPASHAVWARARVGERSANLSLVLWVAGDGPQLAPPVRKLALAAVTAASCLFPGPAKLCLVEAVHADLGVAVHAEVAAAAAAVAAAGRVEVEVVAGAVVGGVGKEGIRTGAAHAVGGPR
mmetsp:Transcript_5475/g.13285  ORF Transcript_5475/g.13285 Transcript_5475/m.13285 type:complete len:214 (+) Transcript_5475:644-1285(+)